MISAEVTHPHPNQEVMHGVAMKETSGTTKTGNRRSLRNLDGTNQTQWNASVQKKRKLVNIPTVNNGMLHVHKVKK